MGSIFGRSWLDFPSQLASQNPPKSIKIDAKRHSNLDFKFWTIFDRFLLPTWTLRTQFGTSRLAFSWFFRYSANIDFGSDLGANLPPFSSQNPSKFHQKSIFKGIKQITDFRIDFYAVLAPTWSHLGPQVGAILALKIIQEPPKTPPKTHLGARAPPRPPKLTQNDHPILQNEAPDPHVGSILTSTLDIQTSFWNHLENDFAPFTGWIFDCFC